MKAQRDVEGGGFTGEDALGTRLWGGPDSHFSFTIEATAYPLSLVSFLALLFVFSDIPAQNFLYCTLCRHSWTSENPSYQMVRGIL